jgi:thiamine transport system substrate-binding protein
MKKLLLVFCIFALALGACTSGAEQTSQATGPAEQTQPPTAAGGRTLRVMTHDSFAVSEPVVEAFQQENNVKVQFIKSGDAGTALNKAILSKGNPLADVFYGVDNTFLSRALAEDIFDPYASPALAGIPAAFQLDPQNRALPVDYGDVCLNYDIAYFKDKIWRRPSPGRLEAGI